MAPGGHEGSARRYLVAVDVLRHLAPGGTHHPPGNLEAAAPGGTCTPRQAILLLQCWVAGFVGVIYKASGDASKVGLLVFLELSSERIS